MVVSLPPVLALALLLIVVLLAICAFCMIVASQNRWRP